MSELSGPGPSAPQDYAPPWLREKSDQRLSQAGSPGAERDTKPEPAGRPRAPSLDWQLENAVFESLRHALDPEVMPEPPGLARNSEWWAVAGYAGRVALAVGVAAVVALLFVIIVPVVRQPTATTSFASALENSTAALSRFSQAQDSSKPALSEFKGLMTTSGDASQSAAPRPSGPLLQQFLVWRDKASPNDPSQ